MLIVKARVLILNFLNWFFGSIISNLLLERGYLTDSCPNKNTNCAATDSEETD
jgi:hypothetical protein